ncbi:ABC transporter permease [Verminephrobacter eiseniae]|uniref:Transport permease protein n=1 Tax=Verminephrobacter eiseniae (strain EF01-2) TaxID=391735 RepID=A1WFP9_VEREI|nr:ABC transporter permease [Verminephrobacter eiseniae]KAB7623303.1 ABC transporter [Verminephrobacter sp. Larva24]ABM56456.1 ABC-2 type transporter [Verminephrobacter eiseniae EF01-2]MCW5233553.1 ABC transporter [Verminephrobacter eiseniae]MCW5261666.1 ABC transporter [Verminephrobacter eiseniae]MCW5286817.1 ABC transporter [Verminephrobacter eiseniae]
MCAALAADVLAVWRARALLWVLVRREVAARHAGTAAGLVWPYLQPLLTVAAYYLVFDVVFAMRLGAGAPAHAVGTFLIVGALPWMAFCDAVSRGMGSLIDAGSLLQKNALPPVLFATRAVLASAVIYGPLLLALALAYTPLHGWRPAVVAGLLPLLALQLLLGWLLGYLLAIFAAALRDTVQAVGFMLSVGIFLSPILFPLTLFPAAWRWVLWLNPMTALVLGYQQLLLQGNLPPREVWAVAAVWVLLLAWLLDWVLRRSRDQLVDWL